MDDDEKEARRKRQVKKMTKIISKAWSLPHADHFQEARHPPTPPAAAAGVVPYDLTTVGQALDAGAYHLGRHGWEKFAKDMGGIYNRHIVRKGKHVKSAKRNLDEVKTFLAKIDPHLAEIAEKSIPPDVASESSSPRPSSSSPIKRKAHPSATQDGDGDGDRPKKSKHARTDSSTGARGNESLTISQREERAMQGLGTYLEECGGSKDQADGFTCKVTQLSTTDKYNTVFYNAQGRRLRSMVDVAKFLNLIKDDNKSAASSSSSKKQGSSSKAVVKPGSGKPRNNRELESEQRKLRKELDKLLKAHEKATKALDDHRSDHKNDRYPVEDELLLQEEGRDQAEEEEPAIVRHLCRPDVDGFPGIPVECTQDLLMVWDFLCTFSRPLSLDPIELDDFAAALIQRPKGGDGTSSPPLYLAEAHLALLRLLLGDASSDEWWWSTLETEETETEEGKGNVEYSKKRREEQLIPVIKCDLGALLAVEEESSITTSWLQALEDVRARKPNSGGPIKSAVKSAMSVTRNPLVRSYLKKSLRMWRGNSAGLTKRAAVWLVDRVREARPDLWGRNVSKEEVAEQTAKVASEAALYMDQVDENVNIDSVNEAAFEEEDMEQDSESEDDVESDDDDDDDDQDATTLSSSVQEKGPAKDEASTPVTSSIPVKPAPTIVDLLLPPGKPQPGSDLVSPFTWPYLAGATSCRILHRYKRRRNEVDDSLRELRELPPMSIAERRRREALAPYRILSECFSVTSEKSAETATNLLCSGKAYAELFPVQKLCILRLLVEAAYDSHRVQQCVEDNIKSRINAVKALDTEERRAKREAREEAAAAESAARERLAKEGREAFIQKKRREIARANKKTNEFTTEFIEGLTDEDVAEFDEDTKAEYEALPAPESFSRSAVNAMVAKIHEEAAFDTHTLVVLTLEEIEAREDEILASMQEELAEFGDVDVIYEHADRETTAKIDKVRRQISDFKESMLSLPKLREEAMEGLRDAIEDGTIKALKMAMKAAEVAWLEGDDEDTEGVWALDLLRDAALELKSAERRKRVTEAQKDLIAKRNKCFVRTDPVGRDRRRNSFWHFDNDGAGRVWAEAEYVLKDIEADTEETKAGENLNLSVSAAKIGADDEECDFLSNEIGASDGFLRFSRQEYHSSGLVPALVKRHWGCHATDKSLRSLMKNLEGRGLREGALKNSLKEIVEAIGVSAVPVENRAEQGDGNEGRSKQTEAKEVETANYQTSGDDDHFRNAMELARCQQNSGGSGIAFEMLESMTSAIGQRLRLRKVPDPVGAPADVYYEMGTVTGWKLGGEGLNEEGKSTPNKMPVWSLAVDNGGEEQLSGPEVLDGLSRFLKWRSQHEGYVEDDAPLFQYRNSLGRFCGRAADAPYASTPSFFAKLLLKKEQDFYTPLKNRAYENNWGGKSGARNAWVASMKEYGHDFQTVHDGLLTLEDVFFTFCGGFPDDAGTADADSSAPKTDDRSGKELIEDEKNRFDIELESIGQATTKSLWNTRDTRKIFKEIVTSSTTVGVLALCLDLLCRNTQAYLEATKPAAVTRNSSVSRNSSEQFEQQPLMWAGRRSTARQQSYSEFFD